MDLGTREVNIWPPRTAGKDEKIIRKLAQIHRNTIQVNTSYQQKEIQLPYSVTGFELLALLFSFFQLQYWVYNDDMFATTFSFIN